MIKIINHGVSANPMTQPDDLAKLVNQLIQLPNNAIMEEILVTCRL